MRSRLNQRRDHITEEVSVGGRSHNISVGTYPGGQAGEVFINGAKAGSEYQAVLDDGGILMSLLMQHGVDAAIIAESLGRTETGERTSALGMAADMAAAITRGKE